MTLRKFVEEKFKCGEMPNLKPTARDIYSRLWAKHLRPRFGETHLYDLKRVDVQIFLQEKLRAGLAWETVNHLRNLLSKYFSTAQVWGFLPANPLRGVRMMPEKTERRPRRWLTKEQAEKLLAHLREPARSVVIVGMFTGLRIGEILALRWKAVDLEGKPGEGPKLTVAQTLSRGKADDKERFSTPKTRASRREIPLGENVLEILKRIKAGANDAGPEGLVFCTKAGTALSADNLRRRQLAEACQAAGIPRMDWHALRRTHATLGHAAGVPLKVMQAQLGHARQSTTLDIYTHTLIDAQRDAVRKLEQMFTVCSRVEEPARVSA
jgi:integrase